MKSQIDTYQEVTDRILAALEAGTKPWAMGWNNAGGGLALPRRATGQHYRGINVLLLWGAAEERGYTGQHWFTFKQAIDLGGNVRKGEKGTRIVFFKTLDVTKENDAGEAEAHRIPLLRTYTVFNYDQCENLPDRFKPAPLRLVEGKERDEAREAALRSCGAEIVEAGNSAFYQPGLDRVTMPTFDRFHTAGNFLATLAHELCHWTGHKSRLDRDQRGGFGSPAYAAEELVAELGAAFVGARLGIVGEHIENHAAYLGHWIKALRGDKRAIFKAAAAAQLAADMVLANAGEIAGEDPAELEDAAPAAQEARQAPAGQLSLQLVA